eukprot:scaffold260955_cov30-Tisochrysis_lutea.AAC.1
MGLGIIELRCTSEQALSTQNSVAWRNTLTKAAPHGSAKQDANIIEHDHTTAAQNTMKRGASTNRHEATAHPGRNGI